MENAHIDFTPPDCGKKKWMIDEDIVISGIGGRFPESDNIDELAANLMNNIDMVTRDDRRWPIGIHDNQVSRMGKIKNLQHFDNTYFCTLPILSDSMEPGSRIILETTYEAIADAGFSPQQIRGSKTGVYVGINSVASAEQIPQDDFSDVGAKNAAFWIYYSSKCLLANRISFLFDFTGPSTVMDTACSASLVALAQAVSDMRTGACDMAVVATSNILLSPYSNYIFTSLGLFSHDGKCKVFDKNADGFVRSETVGSLFLMRRSMAKRIYATILHAKTNTDGFKTVGLFAPFWLRQRNLMIETYKEAGIEPEEIDYFEAHGTGTNVGDPQEAKAVSEAYCKNRKEKLLVGAVKSNLGHTEGASGICSVAKSIIIFENKTIPANLHFSEAKPEIECLHKTIEPVVRNTPFNGKIIGVNSFGIGGVNAHTLLKVNERELEPDSHDIASPIPRLVTVCGRTEESVNYLFDFIEQQPDKVNRHFLALLNDSMKTTSIKGSSNFSFRGYMIIEKTGDSTTPYKYSRVCTPTGQQQPLWLVFSGMGSQWSGMGKQLMQSIPLFAESIRNSAQTLNRFGIDLIQLISTDSESVWTECSVNSFVAITAMQIALFDVFKQLNLKIDGIIGHSFGEIACAYADGCLTAEQTILTSYWRGKTVEESKQDLPKGLMAAVGLSVVDTAEKCPEDVYVACHNGNDSVTVSGLYEPMLQFIDKLQSENIFVRKVAGGQFPYHSEQMERVAPPLLEKLKTVIVEPRKRSSRWVTTSVPPEQINDNDSVYANAEYFVNNLQRPVLFEEGMAQIPKKAFCLEVAPHSLFSSIFKRCYNQLQYLSLMKKDEANHLIYFLSSIGQIYSLGLNPSIECLYPKVEWPVARGTQSIGSLIKWDHSRDHELKRYPEYHNFSTASSYIFKLFIYDSDWRFLEDHTIDGRIVFPLTGYLLIVWRAMATKVGQPWHKVRIHFENIRIFRPTIINESGGVKFVVQIMDRTGDFVLSEGNSLICTGKVSVPDNENSFLEMQHELVDITEDDLLATVNDQPSSSFLNNKDIYKELRIRGYDYGPTFQGLQRANGDGNDGIVQWTGHWISFADSVLHLSILSLPFRALFVPVGIDSLKCDPFVLFDSIKKAKDLNQEVIQSQVKNKEQIKSEFFYFRDMAKENEIIDKEEIQDFAKNDDTLTFEIMNFTFESDKVQTEKKVLFNAKFDFSNQFLVSKGIEVKGLIPINVPRKTDIDNLMLERSLFIPFNQQENFHIYENYSLDQYVQLCSELVDQIEGKLSSLAVDSERRTDEEKKDQSLLAEQLDRFLSQCDNKSLFAYLRALKETWNNLNNKLLQQKSVADHIEELAERLSETNINADLLNDGVYELESFARPVLELFAENNQRQSSVKVLEISPLKNLLALSIIKWIKMNVVHKFDLSYVATRHQELQFPSELSDLRTLEWNMKDVGFLDDHPEEYDLIIVRCNRKTESLWQDPANVAKLLQALKPSGYILLGSRSRVWLKFEKKLHKLIDQKELAQLEQDQTALAGLKQLLEGLCSTGQLYPIANRCHTELSAQLVLYKKPFLNPDDDRNAEIYNNHNIRSVYLKSDTDFEFWFNDLQSEIKLLTEENTDSRIWLISDSQKSGLIGFANCLRLEPIVGTRIRVVYVPDLKDQAELLKALIEFDIESPTIRQLVLKDLAFNIYQNGQWGSYRFLSLSNLDQKITTEHAYINQKHRGDLSSLEWFDSDHKYFVEKPLSINGDKQLLCHIYYSALNFKDIVLASGKIVSGPESALFDCILGLEFAGRRNDTGERIMGMVPFKGIATSTLAHKDFLWSVPYDWSLEDAATVPVIYITAYYALVMRGQIKQNESILIHSAAGGVGQAAITICQHYQCEIFVTVGTEQKREYIAKKFSIPDDHILNSRDVTFERQIKTITKGRGVDLVLNSLAGDKLQASLRCLALNGRFLEIGKYDMQMNSTLGMFAFLKNISFHGVCLDSFFREGLESRHLKEFVNEITKLINDGITKKIIQPIDRTVFEKEQVEKAFRYMSTGKHIGKVLIRMRDEERPLQKSVLKPEPVLVQALTRTWFNPYKVYVIAGGLGGVGLELVYWMVVRGARKFVLTSRSGLRTAYQRVFLQRFNIIEKFCAEYKIDFHISTNNIADRKQCGLLIDEALQLADQIGGIFNLTLVLEDGLFENQTIEKFDNVCQPKLVGLANLDGVLRERGILVDHFVAFSSFAAGRGNEGQTNYGYANSAMERILQQRNQDGLAGLAVQFGAIGDVGIVAEKFLNEGSEGSMKLLLGLSLQRINSCLDVLDRILPIRFGIFSSYVKYVHDANKTSSDDEVLKQLCLHLNIDKRHEDECLGDIGLDSMAAVEIQQRLERDFSISLSLADVRKITVKELKNFRDGNRSSLKQYSEDIKKAKANLSKLRFVIPSTEITQLNSVTTGKPIYCLPPLIGIFDLVLVLAKKIDRPVFGLNWTAKLNTLASLKEIVSYYQKLICKFEGDSLDGTYDLISLDFGSLLAMLMCKSKKIHKQLKIRHLISIDVLPFSMESMTNEKMLNDYKVHVMFDYIQLYIPERICEQSKKEILELNCEKARLEKIIELLKKCCGSSLQGQDMNEIISNTYERASMMIQYQFKLRNKSKNTIRRLALAVLRRNKQLKLDYIKLIKKNESIKDCENKIRTILFDVDKYEEEFADRYQTHILKASQEETLAQIDSSIENVLTTILNRFS